MSTYEAKVIHCEHCRHWEAVEHGWGNCTAPKTSDSLRVLGGYWLSRGDFGCIHGEKNSAHPRKAKKAVDNPKRLG